jgi:4-hydroxy-L-threonine phosphate dehydrogenase PdxA
MRALALTIGEPAGIGCDIALAAWLLRRECNLPAFYVVADPQHVVGRARDIGIAVPIETMAPCPWCRLQNVRPRSRVIRTKRARRSRWLRSGTPCVTWRMGVRPRS